MTGNSELTFKGYTFTNPEDVELAKNELRKIEFLEGKLDHKNIEMLKTVYDKALENHSFQTPLGLSFLHDLYDELINSGVSEDEIRPIPLYNTFRRVTLSESEPVKKRTTKAEKEKLSLSLKYRNACIISGILGALIVVLLLITFNGSTPNAINYKTAITNQYSAWEQELTEREEAVREKERELNIDN